MRVPFLGLVTLQGNLEPTKGKGYHLTTRSVNKPSQHVPSSSRGCFVVLLLMFPVASRLSLVVFRFLRVACVCVCVICFLSGGGGGEVVLVVVHEFLVVVCWLLVACWLSLSLPLPLSSSLYP